MQTNPPIARHSVGLAAICLTALMFGLEISSIPVILPTAGKVLNGSFSQLQWIMNAYTIACTTVLMITGSLSDRLGRRRIYLVSISIFGITSLCCGLSQSISLLIASRFLQGLSGGAMLIGQISNLSANFQSGKQRARAFSAWGIVFGAGLGFGPIIGGVISTFLSWKWVFMIHLPLAIVAIVCAALGLQETRDPDSKRIAFKGLLLLTLSVFSLTWFITQGPANGFFSTSSFIAIAAAVIGLILFIAIEKNNPNPSFDFSLFRIRNFSGALFGSMGMNFSFWPFIVYLPIYYQIALGYNAVNAGLAILPYPRPTLLAPPLGERLALRYRPGFVIPLGLATIGIGFFAMALASNSPDAGWLTMLPGAILAGIGLGLTNTPVTNTTTSSVSSHKAGMASGIDTSARLITLAINIAVMGFILTTGIYNSLRDRLEGSTDIPSLHVIAEKLAAGESVKQEAGLQANSAVIQTAFRHGFTLMIMYGGIGVTLLAILSALTFEKKSASQDKAPRPAEKCVTQS